MLASFSLIGVNRVGLIKLRLANHEQVCKPNSVSRRIGMAIIHLGQSLPAGSSDLPGGRCPDMSGHRAGSPVDASLFGLALRGVCLAASVATRAGALLL